MRPLLSLLLVLLVPTSAAALEVREVATNVAGSQASEHAVFWWGPDHLLDQEDIDRTLELFEVAWEHEVETLGYAAPPGTSAYKLNIYLVESGLVGPGIPAVCDCGAGFGTDPDGFGIMLIDPSIYDGPPSLTGLAIAHELAHGAQTESRFLWTDTWLAEAHAHWVATELFPEAMDGLPFAHRFQVAPDLPLQAGYDHLDRPDGRGDLGRAYAEFLMLRHVADRHGSELIRDVWLDDGGHDRAIPRLDELLQEDGSTFEQTLLAARARMWTLDFADRERLLSMIRDVSDDGTWRTPVAELLEGSWVSPPDGRRPGRWGDAPFRFVPPDDGPWTFTLRGASHGDEGTATTWAALLVAELPDDGFSVEQLTPSAHGGQMTVDVAGATELWLIAIPFAAQYETFETFDVSVRVDRVTEEGGCGGPTAMPWSLGLVGALALFRRPRRGPRPLPAAAL